MLLPFPANVFQLKSFWLVMNLIIGLFAGSILSLLISSVWFLSGILLAFILSIPGMIWPDIANIPYRAFNKIVRIVTHYANESILRICFFVIHIAGGKKGSFFRLTCPGENKSQWIPRHRDSSGIYELNNAVSCKEYTQRNWFYTFIRWILKSGNWWMLSLVPTIILISFFKEDKVKTASSENIYTLY